VLNITGFEREIMNTTSGNWVPFLDLLDEVMIIDEVQLDRPERTLTGTDPANPLEFDLTHNYNITLFVTASARNILSILVQLHRGQSLHDSRSPRPFDSDDCI
jgi:hypothetical protein